MTVESRTAKSIKNSIVALGFYIINLMLQFFSRKIFLDYLGAEVLGLNTTATNLLQFLNLAELGIGTTVGFTLYKPLHDKDENTINEIVSLQGWMYRKIAWIVIIGSAVLMCLFPLIFAKTPLPLWYAYASFSVLLVSALLSYFINYKQIVLSADQKEYKIQYSYRASMLIKVLMQIFAIRYLNNGYVWWLILETIFAIIASISLDKVIKNTYPFLHASLANGKLLRKKYPEILAKVKQAFFHKIGGFALTQSSPIIIYAYTSLTLVALYGNYMLIINGVTYMMNAVFNSMGAGIGNLVAEGNKERILTVFEELFSIRYLLACTICYAVYFLTPGFITLWIGEEYVMDKWILVLMVAILYINLTRSTVDNYISAYGLFSDIWAPMVEAFINIGMSILLGYFFGLYGILSGVLISLIVIVICWKPYFLFKNGLYVSIYKYAKIYIKHTIILFVVIGVVLQISKSIITISATNWLDFIITGSIYVVLFSITLLFGLLSTSGMRSFIRRIIMYIKFR